MDIPVKPEVLQEVAEYVKIAQPIIDAFPGLKAKAEELEGQLKTLQKDAAAKKSIEAVVDLLINSGLVPSEKKAQVVEKLTTDAVAAKEVIANLLASRGLAVDSLGSGVDSAETKSASPVKGDEFDAFVRT